MCFRPAVVKKNMIACPECKEMNTPSISIESQLFEIVANEKGKRIIEKYFPDIVNDARYRNVLLRQVTLMSGQKINKEICDLIANELDQLPKRRCKNCGRDLP